MLFRLHGPWQWEAFPIGWWTLLAVAADMEHPALENVLVRLKQVSSPVILAHQRRAWAESFSERSWSRELADIFPVTRDRRSLGRWRLEDPVALTEWEFLIGSPEGVVGDSGGHG